MATLPPFGEAPDPASGYCQRWLPGGQHSWRHVSEGGFDRREYDVAPIQDDTTARRFVEQFHYSASYPSARLRYGLYHRGGLVGVAVLSVPVSKFTLTNVFPALEPYRESLELGRLILADAVPANAESWMLARVWELAGAEGIKGVVSFSDPVARTTADGALIFPGHVGTIYQASNAAYLGRSTAGRLALLPDGTVFNQRAMQKVRGGERGCDYAERRLIAWGTAPLVPGEDRAAWLATALRTANVRWLRHPGNHKYAFALGQTPARRRRVAVAGTRQTYPKRPDESVLAEPR